jgi:VCBS repeat-containing protein
VNPISGTVPALSSATVDVTFDSTGYAVGVYTGTLCVNSNDALNPVVSVPLTMTVLPNQVPVAVADAYSVTQGITLTVAAPGVLANDSDGDGDDLTAVLDTDVTSGTLTLNADGSFTYTPDAGFAGTDSFTYHANDGTDDSNIATVTLAVTNSAPVAVADEYETAANTALNVAAPGVLDNDSDADGDDLTAVLDSDVSNGSLTLNADGSFVYTPDAGFTGSDTFTYHANDGLADSNGVTVTITVAQDNYTLFLPFVVKN